MNREKINAAGERICEIFEELHLTFEERAVVAYSLYTVSTKFWELEELRLTREEKERPQQISKNQIITAVCSSIAIIVSIICILAIVWK